MPTHQKYKANPSAVHGAAKHVAQVRPSALLAIALAAATLATSATLNAATADRNLAVAAAPASAATSSQRVALVIGNSNYKDAPLTNPVNDARSIAQALKESGFVVTLRENSDMKTMLASIREFGDHLRKGGVGVFYYAGHGMQIKGRNYLIPVGSTIEREDEVAYAAVDAQAVLDKMDAAGNGTNIMILDACRNNPFTRSFRSGQQGLAQMDAPVGTLVAFATAPGSVASDGASQNGLYTQHLLNAMREPGTKVEDVFKKVRSAVRRDSQNRQVPWESTSLEGDFYFRAPVAAESVEVTLERTMWGLVKDSNQTVELKAYLQRFPKGANAAEASARIAKLEAARPTVQAGGTPSPNAPPANAGAAPAGANPANANNARPAQQAAAGQQVASIKPDDELAAWEKVRTSKDPEQYRAFLQRFSNRKYSIEAVNRIMELEEEAARNAPETPPTGTTNAAVKTPPATAPAAATATNKQDATNPWGMRVGDRWNFQVVDKYKGEVVNNFTRKVSKILENGDWISGNTRFTPSGEVRSYSDKTYASRVYTDSAAWIPKTLKAGYKQDFQYSELSKRTDGTSFIQEWKGTITVKGKETIKVPAGEFEAWRLVREANGERKESAGSASRLVRNDSTIWFVPELHHWVAWEEASRSGSGAADITRMEMTSFEVRDPTLATAFK